MEECRLLGPIEVSFSVTGDSKEMHPVVRDEIHRVGYEAIRNARIHSRGSRLDVELKYGTILLYTSETMVLASTRLLEITAKRDTSGCRGCASGSRESEADWWLSVQLVPEQR